MARRTEKKIKKKYRIDSFENNHPTHTLNALIYNKGYKSISSFRSTDNFQNFILNSYINNNNNNNIIVTLFVN